MSYSDMAPSADKWLHSDGSVTTMSGEIILPEHPDRAADYASRMPQAAKWLMSDGSITDALPISGDAGGSPDPDRAADYASRTPQAAKWLMPNGSVTDALPLGGNLGGGLLISDDVAGTHVFPVAAVSDVVQTNIPQIFDGANAVLV